MYRNNSCTSRHGYGSLCFVLVLVDVIVKVSVPRLK